MTSTRCGQTGIPVSTIALVQVPAGLQHMVRKAYFAYLGFFVVVTFNWFASLMAMCVINPNDGRIAGFLLANLYWFAGLPGAWILWQAPHS